MVRRLSTQFIVIVLFLFSSQLSAQMNAAREAVMNAIIENERYLKDQTFKVPSQSPFSGLRLESFTNLNYFDPDMNYKIFARLVRDESQEPVTLLLSNGKSQDFLKYGTVFFSFDGAIYQLDVFRNQNLPELKENPQNLFIPFFDETTGKLTFEKGRYYTFKPPPEGDGFDLDFNKCINPYSAYSSKYQSVIPPTGNILPVSINAGEKLYYQPAK